MNFAIRKFEKQDKVEVINMMKTFYSSDAVSTNGSAEIFETNFRTCLENTPYLEGFVFIRENTILGYSMIAKSYSTEFGKSCIWLEDLYLKPECRGQGIIPKVMSYIENLYPNSIFRLEVEDYNEHAVHVYEKMKYQKLPYLEMKK